MVKTKRQINLLYDQLVPLDRWDKIYIWITQVAKYVLMLAEVSLLIVFAVHIMYDHKLDDMKDGIAAQIQLLENRKVEEKNVNIVAKSLRELEELQKDQFSFAKYHEYIYKLVPSGIRLKSLTVTYKTVTMTGDSDNYDNIKHLFDNINNSTKIDKESVTTSTAQKAAGTITFSLVFTFK